MTEISSSVAITAGFETVTTYLADPENLVQWSNMFVEVLDTRGNEVHFKTQNGDCWTHIDTGHKNDTEVFEIISQFQDKREHATMTAKEITEAVRVGFGYQVPDQTPPAVQEAMLKTLNSELAVLAKILEGENG